MGDLKNPVPRGSVCLSFASRRHRIQELRSCIFWAMEPWGPHPTNNRLSFVQIVGQGLWASSRARGWSLSFSYLLEHQRKGKSPTNHRGGTNRLAQTPGFRPSPNVNRLVGVCGKESPRSVRWLFVFRRFHPTNASERKRPTNNQRSAQRFL